MVAGKFKNISYNHSLHIMAFVAIIAVILSCMFYTIADVSAAEKNDIEKEGEELTEKSLSTKFRTAFISDSDGKTVVNMNFPKCDDAETNDLIKQYVDCIVSDFRRDEKSAEGAVLNITYDIFFHEEDVFSVLYTAIKENGEEQNIDNYTAVYDYGKKKQYEFSDMFVSGSGYLEALGVKVRDYIESNSKLNSSFSNEEIDKITVPIEKNFSKLVIEEDELIIIYQPKSISESYNEKLEVRVKLSELEGKFKLGEPSISEIKREERETEPETEPPTEAPTEPPTEAASVPTDSPVYPFMTDTGNKVVALTFDDGPSDETSRLLDALKERDSKATFFLVGNRISMYSSTVCRMVNEGHGMGNHTFDHKNLVNTTPEDGIAQIKATDDWLETVAGVRTSLLRPPEGAYDGTVKSYAGKPIIMWSVDTKDWKYRDTATVVNNVLSCVKSGDIILLHDLYPTSVDAAIQVIDAMRPYGFKFVTVEELFAENQKPMNEGEAYSSGRP